MDGDPHAGPRFLYPRVLKALVGVLLVLAVVGLDQGTKRLARVRLEGRPPVALAGGWVTLRYVENEGAFLSLGSRLPREARMAAFILFPLVVLGAMAASLVRRRGLLGWGTLAGFALIVGGGAGNLIDRLFRDGRVGDFLLLGRGALHTGVFNVADLAVLAGCAVLLLAPARAGPARG
jgi:signal peptidase II